MGELQRYDINEIDKDKSPFFEYPLSRVVGKLKSNLNTYFAKGRLNPNGTVTPRPWYEIELIAPVSMSSNDLYPKGDFIAYTDDGYIIPMRTQGDYYKNIRSKDRLARFGAWLKGKLEKAGALDKFQPVTQEVIDAYGKGSLKFYRIETDKYFLEF